MYNVDHVKTAQKIATWAHNKGLLGHVRFAPVIERLTRIVAGKGKLPTLLGSSVKTEKGEKKGILTGILYLAPADESGVNVCPFASAGCKAACLGHDSGRMRMPANQVARILRTWWFFADRTSFQLTLGVSLAAFNRKAQRKGMRGFVRLNGTSDIHPRVILGDLLWDVWKQSDITFYDYTKDRERALAHRADPHYSLTFSRSEDSSLNEVVSLLAVGVNVAVVFADRLPSTWGVASVIDGDETDARPTDARGVVVGLTTKGPKARNDTSGFVVRSHL